MSFLGWPCCVDCLADLNDIGGGQTSRLVRPAWYHTCPDRQLTHPTPQKFRSISFLIPSSIPSSPRPHQRPRHRNANQCPFVPRGANDKLRDYSKPQARGANERRISRGFAEKSPNELRAGNIYMYHASLYSPWIFCVVGVCARRFPLSS